jgi:hypothetical protein
MGIVDAVTRKKYGNPKKSSKNKEEEEYGELPRGAKAVRNC